MMKRHQLIEFTKPDRLVCSLFRQLVDSEQCLIAASHSITSKRRVHEQSTQGSRSGPLNDLGGLYNSRNGHCLYPNFRFARSYSTVRTEKDSDVYAGKHNDHVSKEAAREKSLTKKEVDANIVLRQPIPKNFIRETYLPHLEHNVAYNAHKFPPAVVLQIAIAYSKLPAFIRQRAIEDSLVETFIYRMVDYTASDCVQLLNTSLQLQGLRNLKVYREVLKRLQDKHVFGSITVLNRLGLVRNISRILQRAQVLQGESQQAPLEVEMLDLKKYRASILKPWTVITSGLRCNDLKKLCTDLVDFGGDSVLPQLEFELQSFDSNELSDLLGVFAERAERDSAKLDFPVIAILMQRIIELHDQTPLSNKLANVCSLCRLGTAHDQYLTMVANELRNPLLVNNIFHRHLARALWAFSRFDMLGTVLEPLLPHLERNALYFEPSSMARLSQIYRGEYDNVNIPRAHLDGLRDVVVRNALFMLGKLEKYSPKDLLFFYTGLCYMHLLPEPADFSSFLTSKDSGILRYAESSPQDFDTMLQSKGYTRTHILELFLAAVEKLEDEFDLSEIQRIVFISKSMPHAEFVLEHLPKSWSKIIEEYEEPKL
ncbi:hypothetical protein BaOVIS_007310 [Babesia ovis]|uniref:Uncharacterized protein n=1 Tax=Babesia ovis TaxID=5869 RepID=A0A9W5TBC3_BABOV|nr:hypothetical protein BaOVIS_007310 [Babesia ovis]